MARYIVTDLTRFSNPDTVCIAVVNTKTRECLRPIPYLKSEWVKEHNIHPGAILEGSLSIDEEATPPHIEDVHYKNLTYSGDASGDEFKVILDQTLSESIASGFGVNFEVGQKYIPLGTSALCSIITIKLLPRALTIHEDKFKPGKIKASFTDSDNHKYLYLSITDRGFFDFAKAHQEDGRLDDVQKFLKTQDEIYLRIGVSRLWDNGTHNGYWLQINGIYSFPNYFEEIRTY